MTANTAPDGARRTTRAPRHAPGARARRWLAAVLLVGVVQTPLGAQTVITTLPNWNGIFGSPYSWGPTFGQTVTVPSTHRVLTSFSFWLSNLPAPGGGNAGNLVLQPIVREWTAGVATPPVFDFVPASSLPGAVLYEGPTFRGPTGEFREFFRHDFVIPGGLELTPGSMYLLGLTGLENTSNLGAAIILGSTAGANPYANGNHVSGNPASTLPASWAMHGDDVAFEAVFTSRDVEPPPPSVVPEPGSVALLATGLLGIGLVGRTRRARGRSTGTG